jgi:hypothetical protein
VIEVAGTCWHCRASASASSGRITGALSLAEARTMLQWQHVQHYLIFFLSRVESETPLKAIGSRLIDSQRGPVEYARI